MTLRFERGVFAAAGADVGALAVAFAEAHAITAAAGLHPPPFLRVATAELGVVAPLALFLGLATFAFSSFVEPDGPYSPAERIAILRAQPVLARSRLAALAPLTVWAFAGWLIFTAQSARVLLSRGAPMGAGVALGVTSVASLLGSIALALALLPPLRRTVAAAVGKWPSALDPAATAGAALGASILVLAVGTWMGDTGGVGPTPLSIFGVFKRPELDLRPLVEVGAIVVCSWTAQLALVGRPLRWPVLFGAAAVAVGSLSVTVYEAMALDPSVAQLIDSNAPFGRIALSLDRRATDRDGDGASPLFGGGDCDDTNPAISPTAVDIPGNGVDEDCSGEDSPRPSPQRAAAAPAVVVRRPSAGRTVDRDFNLILVTIDTLRASELGYAGYGKTTSPNLDALARDSVVFDRAYAMASYTGKALAPMLIGKYPSETLRDWGHFTKYFAGNKFLAERLHDAGLFTMGAASHWYFRPASGVTQGFDTFDLSALPKAGQTDTDTNSTSPQLTDAAIRLLAANAESKRFFLWVHYFDPHAQYVPHPGAPDFQDPGASSASKMRALYDGEVWFTDKAVGRLLDYARAQPWGKNTVVVVTSDHGESMGEHGIAFQHGFELWETLVRVPLIIHVPGLAAHHVPVKRSVIDLVPTLLDLMRIAQPAPGELSGRSAIDDLFAESDSSFEERDVYMDMPDGPYTHLRRALIHGRTPGLKLIHSGGRQYRLYDLATDPDEAEDLAGDADRLTPMVQALRNKRAELNEMVVKPDAPAAP